MALRRCIHATDTAAFAYSVQYLADRLAVIAPPKGQRRDPWWTGYNRTPIGYIGGADADHPAPPPLWTHASAIQLVVDAALRAHGQPYASHTYVDGASFMRPGNDAVWSRTWLRAGELMPDGKLYALTVQRGVRRWHSGDVAYMQRFNNPVWWPLQNLGATEAEVAEHKRQVAELFRMYPRVR